MLIFALFCCVPCVAENNECKLIVHLSDAYKNTIDAVSVSICKVADIHGTDYFPTQEFENSGISLARIVNNPSAENAENVFKYVQKNNISAISEFSQDGKAVFSSLDKGIWLVFCNENQTHSFNPFIVFLPHTVRGKTYYEISSAPKIEENKPNNRAVYVVKKWDDNNNSAKKRPQSITVNLKLDGEVVDKVILDSSNGWSHTFKSLTKEGRYTVEEKEVEGYTAEYNGDSDNGFVITNTYKPIGKLPQTGQYWLPIIILFVAGAGLVLLGIIELKVKKNEKK